MASRKMKKTVDVEQGVLVIEIAGEKKVYQLNDLNEIVMLRAALHGLSQKLGDSCAGREPSFTTIDNVWKQISGDNGQWSVRKPAEKKVGEAEFIQALIDTGMPREAAQAIFDKTCK